MPSSSMEPTLHCARPAVGCLSAQADQVDVEPGAEIRRFDIVAFKTPPAAAEACGIGGVYIKRVIGLPGEAWSERRGVVSIDGKALPEPFIAPGRRDEQTWPARRVGPNSYLVLGDNRSHSCDSRFYGTVRAANVIGKAIAIERGSKKIDLR